MECRVNRGADRCVTLAGGRTMTLQVWRDGAKRTAVLPVEGHKSFGSCPEANGQTAALFWFARLRNGRG
jgi:hypothetical protein